MRTFNNYLIEAKNTHMEHIEDLILNKGIVGARESFHFLFSIFKMLEGDSKVKIAATVKWDGAPAILMGIDPADSKFFIAKKSLFNKTPRLYKTHREIDVDITGDLADKFHIALDELPKLGLKKGVVQGDFMFGPGDVQKETIEGKKYVTFHPNTIVYAVPAGSRLSIQISKAKIGIVWHTTYSGDSITNLSASFGKSIIDHLKHVPSVWMDDATYKDLSGQVTMTAAESAHFRSILTQAGKLLHKIPAHAVEAISQKPALLNKIKKFNNAKIRTGEHIGNTTTHVRELINTLLANKTDKSDMAPLANMTPTQLKVIFDFMNLIIEAKHIIVGKMDRASEVGTFLRTASGFKVTTPEGYVCIDHLGTGAVKLVDRLEFSRANFSPDIIRGWTK